MPDEEAAGLRDDIDGFFHQIRTELGFTEDDGELDLDPDDVAMPDPTPPSPVSQEPPSRHIPEAVPVEEPEEQTYPGSRHTRRGLQEDEETEEEEAPRWDVSPRVYRANNQNREFFPISALASALHRKAGTLRKWETLGYLPAPRYRGPDQIKRNKKTGEVVSTTPGSRLYTRPQIEGLIAIAEEEGLMQPKKKMRIDQTRFPDRAARLFAALERRS